MPSKDKPCAVVFMLFLVCFALNQNHLPAQDLFINEFLASNSTISQDPDYHSHSDWIEIYNPSTIEMNVAGYHLTDNLDTTRWQIPAGTVIPGRGFLVLWADGKNERRAGHHTNFKLSKEGEEIGLFDRSGVLIDSVTYGIQATDISLGRQPDGMASWVQFAQPTPGAANLTNAHLQAAAPEFSLTSGFYAASQTVTLMATEANAEVRYTLDGNEPSETSALYTGAIAIESRAGDPNVFSEILTNLDPPPWLPNWVGPSGEVFKATVVRARAFVAGKQPSDIATATYFVDANIAARYPTIAVISLVSDYRHLFSAVSGIYVPGITHQTGNEDSGNYFQDWEKPAHIDFFEPGGQLGFAQDVGIKIQGGSSPASPQKGLHVIARSEYGNNRIRHPIFANSKSKAGKLTKFKRFMIRAWGSTILAAMFNDAYGQRLLEESDMDIQAYRPAVVFINGEYWGLHELRETNKSSWYYQFHYGIDRQNPGVDILQHEKSGNGSFAQVDEGDAVHWNAMMNFLNTHDMSQSENYEYVKTQMDVENFIAYIGHCAYVGKWDWPNNNDASWRPRTPDGKWRWIQFDMETGFGVATGLGAQFAFLGPQYNMLEHTIHGLDIIDFGRFGPHPVLAQLVTNDAFNRDLVRWFDARMASEFHPDTMNVKLDEMVAGLAPYMQEYQERWPFEGQIGGDWQQQIDEIRHYISERPAFVRQHLLEQFGDTSLADGTTSGIPDEFRLLQNYPNPFNPTTTISYELPNASDVTITIFNIAGQEIARLQEGRKAAGRHAATWDAGVSPSGVYFYEIKAGDFIAARKMLLVR